MNNKSSKKDLEVFKQLSILWNTFKYVILDEYVQDKYPGLRIARMDLKNSNIKTHDSEFLKLSIMQLFIKYGYTTLSDYGKFTISYVIYKNQMKIPFTKGSSIVFRENGEEYPDFLYTSFEERSSKMMNDFVDRLALVCEKDRQKIKTVYFHNFARFDGILLLKHFLNLGNKYTIKPLIVNKHLYEISVYKGKKHLFNLRDSYTLLPSSLRSLASNLCPNHLKLRKCASGPFGNTHC